jgi:hypothetical protein
MFAVVAARTVSFQVAIAASSIVIKPWTSLTDGQVRTQAKLDWLCNVTLSAVNLVKLEARQPSGPMFKGCWQRRTIFY